MTTKIASKEANAEVRSITEVRMTRLTLTEDGKLSKGATTTIVWRGEQRFERVDGRLRSAPHIGAANIMQQIEAILRRHEKKRARRSAPPSPSRRSAKAPIAARRARTTPGQTERGDSGDEPAPRATKRGRYGGAR